MTDSIDEEKIREAIRKRYREVSGSAEGCFKYPTGREGALKLGYDREIVDNAPEALLKSFCGVGNPFSLGRIFPGNNILDIGCGGGFDLYVASGMAGDAGSVDGIDMTPEMAAAAWENIREAGLSNVTIQEAMAEDLPFEDCTFDMVISNGVLNLSPRKHEAFREIWRVLKPEGRLQFADIVLNEDLPEEKAGSLEAWSD